MNNCGTSTLSIPPGEAILWSKGATTTSITVTTAGTYAVRRTIDGCSGYVGSAVAAPVALPATPVVTVVNNCGSSTLSTTASGTLLWSNGATTASITVSTAGTYTVTQTVNGCTSAAGSGTAAPNTITATPVVTVVNSCGNSTLSIPAGGTILWSNGATTASITVSIAGTYTVTRTVSGCTSAAGSGTAAPNALTATPVVTVANNCSYTTLSIPAGGTILWSNGATTPSINVYSPGTYTVKQNVNGCNSAAGSGVAAPKTIPAAPVVTVVNNCGSSTLSIPAGEAILWSNGATTTSITVTTAGLYAVRRTIDGCAGYVGSAVAAPGCMHYQ